MSSGGGFNLLHVAHERGVYVSAMPFIICFIAANISFLTLDPGQTIRNWEFLLLSSPLWLPIVLGRFAFLRWMSMNRMNTLLRQDYVLLEVRMPRDVRKTPLAMEAVFTSMHLQPGESNWWKRIVRGAVRPWWSVEIASIGGRVHFFIWTRTGFRRGFESYMYAQYPEVEIVEAMDYSRMVDPSHAPYDLWATDYTFRKADVYPFKTYIDFLRPDAPLPKPEEQIDQLAQILELFGSLGPKEQVWLQIMFRASKNERWWGKKNAKGATYSIKDMATEELEKLRQQTVRKQTHVGADGSTYETETFPNPTRGVQQSIEAIERKVSKPIFDVGMRCIYLAPQDAYQGVMVSHVIGLFRNYHSEQLNGFGIVNWFANFDDWPWEDTKGIQHAHVAHNVVDAYRRRSFFLEPYRLNWMLMNAEELASLWHPPSSGVATPSLPRIQSSTSEPPSNLPI